VEERDNKIGEERIEERGERREGRIGERIGGRGERGERETILERGNSVVPLLSSDHNRSQRGCSSPVDGWLA
jgi:hypothetical protein